MDALRDPHAIFHQQSSIEGRSMDAATWTDASKWPKEWSEVSFKSYPRLPSTALPSPRPPAAVSLHEAVIARRSSRANVAEPLELAALSDLLAGALGFAAAPAAGSPGVRRNHPSAGARFPVEAYLLSLRCAGLGPGVYHYGPADHRVTRLVEASPAALSRAALAAFGHPWIAAARAVVLLTAVMPRTTIKYGPRGYRFALLEAGHIMQNLCLLAAAQGTPLAPVGGFADQVVSRLLDLGDGEELPLYSAVLP
jgi:SagB-type dehydrogenase family enzyme